MSHLILVRHGQSEWNLQKRFTGWVDVDLAPQGKLEACKAGELIKELKLDLSYFYCSYQKRAIETLNLILNTLGIKNEKMVKALQLNERHYGALTGLNKDEMKKLYGEKKIISKKLISSYGKNNSILMQHASHYVKGVNFSTGSLGHGLPVAAGLALSNKIKKNIP